jgi:uncharacterized protein with HEPN domain
MKHRERDISALKHIILYCDEIKEAVNRHSLTLGKIKSDSIYKNALSMSILQIGELTNVLSQSFKAEHKDMPWSEIKRMRDKAAHHYGEYTIPVWESIGYKTDGLTGRNRGKII